MGEADSTQAQKGQVIPQCMGQERHEGPGQNLSGDTLMRAHGRSWCQDHSPPCLPDHRALALPTVPPPSPEAKQAAATLVATQPGPAQRGPMKGTIWRR